MTAWLSCQREGQACGCRSFLYSRGLPSSKTWKEAFMQIKSCGVTDLQALWKSRLGEEEKLSGVLRQSVILYTWEAWLAGCYKRLLAAGRKSWLLGGKRQEGLFPEQQESSGKFLRFWGSDTQLWTEGIGSMWSSMRQHQDLLKATELQVCCVKWSRSSLPMWLESRKN